MKLPVQTEILIKQYSNSVKKRKSHDLMATERVNLFLSFGLSVRGKKVKQQGDYLIMAPADKTVAWLGILTAQKVLPIWEEIADTPLIENEEQHSYNPLEMIMSAKQVLNEEITYQEANRIRLSDRFYYGMIGLQDVTTEIVYQTIETAYFALGATVQGWDSKNRHYFGDIPRLMYDFASTGVKAFAGRDDNPPGLWAEVGYYHNDPPYNYQPLKMDPEKQLNFWQWWLNEAIPQAWELAQ